MMDYGLLGFIDVESAEIGDKIIADALDVKMRDLIGNL
jgi:hypothetical protein